MKTIDNQIRNISSSHQDKHSDKVNSHQHHGKVDKTHRAKIVEFDKLDNDSQIDNDFGLHIIYSTAHSPPAVSAGSAVFSPCRCS